MEFRYPSGNIILSSKLRVQRPTSYEKMKSFNYVLRQIKYLTFEHFKI